MSFERSEALKAAPHRWRATWARRCGVVSVACTIIVVTPDESQRRAMSGVSQCRSHQPGPASRLVDREGRPMYIDDLSAVRMGKDIGLFGRQTLLWRSPAIFADTTGMIDLAKAGKLIDLDTLAGAILGANGIATTFGKPLGLGTAINAVAVSDGAAGAWVAWLTAPDTSRRPTDVWVAHFSNQRWGKLEHVLHAQHLQSYSLVMMKPEGSSAPRIAVSGIERSAPARTGVALLQREASGAWEANWLDTGGFWPLRVALYRVDEQRLMMAFVGSIVDPPRRDTNSVFITLSQDGGRNFEPPRVIDTAWNLQNSSLTLTPRANGGITLTWLSRTRKEPDGNVMHDETDDGGLHWRRVPSSLHPHLMSYVAIGSPAGAVALTRDDERRTLALVELRSHEPPVVTQLPWQNAALPQSATTLGDPSGRILVTWGALVPKGYPQFPLLESPLTYFAWMHPCAK